jgi:hypothetical protein
MHLTCISFHQKIIQNEKLLNCIGKLQSGKQKEKSNSYETLQMPKFFI